MTEHAPLLDWTGWTFDRSDPPAWVYDELAGGDGITLTLYAIRKGDGYLYTIEGVDHEEGATSAREYEDRDEAIAAFWDLHARYEETVIVDHAFADRHNLENLSLKWRETRVSVRDIQAALGRAGYILWKLKRKETE